MKFTRPLSHFLFISMLTTPLHAQRFLVFGGKTGWIGQQLVTLLREQGHEAFAAESRLENRKDIEYELKIIKPDFVINTAGITGRPNVDWCEDHQQETIRANLLGVINLADTCFEHGIHMTNLATGCIYEYDDEHPMYSGIGFTENDEPNFDGSFYSRAKIIMEKLLASYPNVLNLRLRMPISDDLSPRSFVGKIIKYQKLVNIPNTMSIVTDLLPLMPIMAIRGLTGIYNFVNPGAISHNEIMDLYIKYIDPHHIYQNFTVEEQDQILKARRSNCELDAFKLLKEFPHIQPIKQSIIHVFERMQKNLGIKR